jgi:hypothetical protein
MSFLAAELGQKLWCLGASTKRVQLRPLFVELVDPGMWDAAAVGVEHGVCNFPSLCSMGSPSCHTSQSWCRPWLCRDAAAAGVADMITFRSGTCGGWKLPFPPEMVVTNPPWGGRIAGTSFVEQADRSTFFPTPWPCPAGCLPRPCHRTSGPSSTEQGDSPNLNIVGCISHRDPQSLLAVLEPQACLWLQCQPEAHP